MTFVTLFLEMTVHKMMVLFSRGLKSRELSVRRSPQKDEGDWTLPSND